MSGELGLFENALRMGAELGRVDFGSVEFDSNFSVSFWLKPDDVDSNKTLILSKQGISGMNLLRIEKGDQNSSLQVYLSLDGQTDQLLISSPLGVLTNEEWVNLTLTYEDVNGSLALFSNATLISKTSGHYFTGTELSSRFTSFVLGGGTHPIEAIIDDLRVYGACLSEEDISNLYGSGGETSIDLN